MGNPSQDDHLPDWLPARARAVLNEMDAVARSRANERLLSLLAICQAFCNLSGLLLVMVTPDPPSQLRWGMALVFLASTASMWAGAQLRDHAKSVQEALRYGRWMIPVAIFGTLMVVVWAALAGVYAWAVLPR